MQSRSSEGFNKQELTRRDKKYSSVTPKVDADLSLVDITVPESGIKDVKSIINYIHPVKIHNLTLHPVNVPLFLTGYGFGSSVYCHSEYSHLQLNVLVMLRNPVLEEQCDKMTLIECFCILIISEIYPYEKS